MKCNYNCILVLFLLFISTSAQSQHFAKYAGDFISTGTGPRALGMGGAYVAVAEGSISSYWNPAGLGRLEFPEIHLMYSERFTGVVKYNFAVVALPYKQNSGLAIGLMRLAIDDIPFMVVEGVVGTCGTGIRGDVEVGDVFPVIGAEYGFTVVACDLNEIVPYFDLFDIFGVGLFHPENPVR